MANVLKGLMTAVKKSLRSLGTWCIASSHSHLNDLKTRVFSYSFSSRENFPGGAVDKKTPANARGMSSIPTLGRTHMLWSN